MYNVGMCTCPVHMCARMLSWVAIICIYMYIFVCAYSVHMCVVFFFVISQCGMDIFPGSGELSEKH